MVENGAAVLGAGVHALAVWGGGVVHFVEELEEGGVGEGRRVEGHLEGFGICSSSTAISAPLAHDIKEHAGVNVRPVFPEQTAL